MALIQISGFSCERCGHKWISRANSEHVPIVCPACKSPYWNIPKKLKKDVKIGGKGK